MELSLPGAKVPGSESSIILILGSVAVRVIGKLGLVCWVGVHDFKSRTRSSVPQGPNTLFCPPEVNSWLPPVGECCGVWSPICQEF